MGCARRQGDVRMGRGCVVVVGARLCAEGGGWDVGLFLIVITLLAG